MIKGNIIQFNYKAIKWFSEKLLAIKLNKAKVGMKKTNLFKFLYFGTLQN